MKTLTMGPYWKVILYGSTVGVALSIGILNLYYLIFFTEYTSQSFGDAIRWGAGLALVTSGLVTCGTLAVARQLGTRRGKILFIILSVLSPIAGWLLLGIINGLLVSWYFFFGFPLIAIVSGIASGIIATFATFFLPRSDPDEESGSTDAPLSLFESDS